MKIQLGAIAFGLLYTAYAETSETSEETIDVEIKGKPLFDTSKVVYDDDYKKWKELQRVDWDNFEDVEYDDRVWVLNFFDDRCDVCYKQKKEFTKFANLMESKLDGKKVRVKSGVVDTGTGAGFVLADQLSIIDLGLPYIGVLVTHGVKPETLLDSGTMDMPQLVRILKNILKENGMDKEKYIIKNPAPYPIPKRGQSYSDFIDEYIADATAEDEWHDMMDKAYFLKKITQDSDGKEKDNEVKLNGDSGLDSLSSKIDTITLENDRSHVEPADISL